MAGPALDRVASAPPQAQGWANPHNGSNGPPSGLSTGLVLTMLQSMTRQLLSFLLIVLCAPAGAAIYHWVDETGKTHYSDQPRPNSRALSIPGASLRAAEDTDRETAQTDADTPFLGTYSAFEIMQPGADQTLIQKSSDFGVSLLLDPLPSDDHRLVILVDNNSIPIEGAATQFTLSGIGFGTHRLQARILDAEDRVMAQTSPQTFHLRPPPPPGPGVLP